MECHIKPAGLDRCCSPGLFNNTLVIYILGDNGASAEGFHGTIDELLTENSLPNTAKQQIEVNVGFFLLEIGRFQKHNGSWYILEHITCEKGETYASLKNDLR